MDQFFVPVVYDNITGARNDPETLCTEYRKNKKKMTISTVKKVGVVVLVVFIFQKSFIQIDKYNKKKYKYKNKNKYNQGYKSRHIPEN